MLKSSLAFCSLSVPAIVLSATLGILLMPGPQENSFTHISCSRDQFNKCVDYCAKRNLVNYGSVDMAKCKKYCRENASSQNGCQ